MKQVVEKKISKRSRESIRSAGEKKRCVNEMARYICLKRRKKQQLSDKTRVRKGAAREWLLLLLEYRCIATRTSPKDRNELQNMLRNQREEALVKCGVIAGIMCCVPGN